MTLWIWKLTPRPPSARVPNPPVASKFATPGPLGSGTKDTSFALSYIKKKKKKINSDAVMSCTWLEGTLKASFALPLRL